MTRNAPRPFESSLRRAVIASSTEFLRASASASGDLVRAGRGSSAFLLQTVVSRVRPWGLHAQRFRLSAFCFESLPESEAASRVRSFRSRSAPGLTSEPVLRATVAGGDRRFEHRWRGAEPALTSSNAAGLPRSRPGPAVACGGVPSRTEQGQAVQPCGSSGRLSYFHPLWPAIVGGFEKRCGLQRAHAEPRQRYTFS